MSHFNICTESIMRNLQVVQKLKSACNVDVLLPLKTCAVKPVMEFMMANGIDGFCSSGVFETELAHKIGPVHVYQPAFDFNAHDHANDRASKIIYNSMDQFYKWQDFTDDSVDIGLRVNPLISTVKYDMYNPCAHDSRLGEPIDQIPSLSGLNGIHIHGLCMSSFEDLLRMWKSIDSNKSFSSQMYRLEWINLGGGHMLCEPGYDIEGLSKLINEISDKYKVKVIIEPGEGLTTECATYTSQILDIHNGNIIIDGSISCHLPDCIEMPYTPDVLGASPGDVGYWISGNTCLAGDKVGRYIFDKTPEIGDDIVFADMLQYTMVKVNNFNGVKRPDILVDSEPYKQFGYNDFSRYL